MIDRTLKSIRSRRRPRRLPIRPALESLEGRALLSAAGGLDHSYDLCYDPISGGLYES